VLNERNFFFQILTKMKALLVVLLITVAFALTDKEQYLAFKEKYGKRYGTVNEDYERYNIFRSNLRRAEKLNREPGQTATFGVTKFMDMTPEEFAAKYLNLKFDEKVMERAWHSMPVGHRHQHHHHHPGRNVNVIIEDLDWTRDPTRVTPVKDQGSCGSCWAFSTTAALEGCTKTGDSLSNQETLDCNTLSPVGDCSGIYLNQMETVVGWAATEGLCKETDYPAYTAKTTNVCAPEAATCVRQGAGNKMVKPANATNAAVIELLRGAPLAVLVAATPFQYYTSGVISGTSTTSGCAATSINHAVLLVGVHVDDSGTVDGNYWKIKNSWAADWGEDGYVRISYAYTGTGTDYGCLKMKQYVFRACNL